MNMLSVGIPVGMKAQIEFQNIFADFSLEQLQQLLFTPVLTPLIP